MRPITVLLACLVLSVPLAGCLSAGATGDAKPDVAAAPQPSASPMPAGRAATAPKPPRGAAANAQASGKKDEWWKEGGVTREKINSMCWMKAEESGGRGMSADKKADLVDKCVAETLKQHPLN
jgi:hypothetical protein